MATIDNIFAGPKILVEDNFNEDQISVIHDVTIDAHLLTTKMQLLATMIAKQTDKYQHQIKRSKGISPLNSQSRFVAFLISVDQYRDLINKYHELLESEECSYKIPLSVYKQLRHQLVIRVLVYLRVMHKLNASLAHLQDSTNTNDFLLKRWQHELLRLSILAKD